MHDGCSHIIAPAQAAVAADFIGVQAGFRRDAVNAFAITAAISSNGSRNMRSMAICITAAITDAVFREIFALRNSSLNIPVIGLGSRIENGNRYASTATGSSYDRIIIHCLHAPRSLIRGGILSCCGSASRFGIDMPLCRLSQNRKAGIVL